MQRKMCDKRKQSYVLFGMPGLRGLPDSSDEYEFAEYCPDYVKENEDDV